ncbi:MAG: GNAT family N-acetyltransferase [Adhaeribacter sp.]
MEPLFIQTNRLQIRNLQPKDLEPFYVYRSNPEVTKYQGFGVMTKEEARNFILEQKNKLFGKPGEWVQYGIAHKLNRALIGDCAIKLTADDPRIAEVGITISHLHQKQGYAKEAFTGILHFLFNTKKLHRVVETVDVENIPSVNLLKSLSFRQEGHFIKNIFFKGNWGSEYQFAMLKEEWDLRFPKYFV